MMKVFQAQFLLCLVSIAAANEQPLVQCALPVHVKFIVAPQQLQPEFNEQGKLGQKHWSAYQCKMNIADEDVVSIVKVRQLQATSNSSEDDDNETTTTTTSATTTTANATNATNVTTTINVSALNRTEVQAEIGGANCWKTWATGLVSIGLSFSLPVAEAAPGAFMSPSQPKKLDDLTDVVEVLMPCSSLLDPLKDLDGDGAFDCKVTQEQNSIAVSVPEIDGTWHVLSAQSVSAGNAPSERRLPRDSITIGGGAWCVDPSQIVGAESKLDHLVKEELPLALTNVARFTHDAKPCGSKQSCEASMWSFDLAYPSSSCTPEVMGWIQPCTAKLLPDGTLVLLRGAPTQSSDNLRRPPLMSAVMDAKDALSFANGVAAATDSSFEVLLVHKHHSLSSGSVALLPGALKLQSDSTDNDVDSTTEVRQLQSVSSSDNSTDEDNETTTTTTTSTATTTSTSAVNTTNASTVNLSALNRTEVQAEIGHASDLRVWSTAFFCFAMLFVVH